MKSTIVRKRTEENRGEYEASESIRKTGNPEKGDDFVQSKCSSVGSQSLAMLAPGACIGARPEKRGGGLLSGVSLSPQEIHVNS